MSAFLNARVPNTSFLIFADPYLQYIQLQRQNDCVTLVLEMNLKLGYCKVRREPIWDEAVRVSLIKLLG